ncbi:hypothetical protein B4U80_14080, partial [Leptotrombidium deliense]
MKFNYGAFQGMGNSLLDCTIMDFVEVLQTNFASVSIGVSVGGIGAGIGCVAVGKFLQFTESSFVLASLQILNGLSAIFITRFSVTYVFYTLIFAMAFCFTSLDVTTYVILTNVLKEKSAPWVQSLPFCASLAAIVTPIIVAPFVSKIIESGTDINQVICVTNSTENCFEQTKRGTKIWIPFTVYGMFNILIALLVISAQIHIQRRKGEMMIEKSEKSNETEEITNETSNIHVEHRNKVQIYRIL